MKEQFAGLLDSNALVDFAQRLVRTPSVNDPLNEGSEEQVSEVVLAEMRSFGWAPTVEVVAPGRPNIIARITSGLSGPTLLFEGHSDVVSPGHRAAWTFDPFCGDIANGTLRGRGAADMKGGVAAMIYAARALELAGPFPGTVVVAVLVDEEEMMRGVKDFVAKGHARGIDAAIVCEPEGGEICDCAKGALRIVIRCHGKMAHGSMPEKGLNPITALAEMTGSLAKIEHAINNSYGTHPVLGNVTLTPTVFEAGEMVQLNVIPAQATLGIDVRTVPGVDHPTLVSRLFTALSEIAKAHNVELDLEIIEDRPPTVTLRSESVMKAMVAAHEEVVGSPAVFGGVPGTTDGTILWRDAQLPVVVYGPGGKWIAHQADEFVLLSEIIDAAYTYAVAASHFLNRRLEAREEFRG